MEYEKISYDGAVKCRAGDPTHYKCLYTEQTYFDAMNIVYKWALSIMCPTLMAAVDWNKQTWGDICESIMGAHYEWSVIVQRLPPKDRPIVSSNFAHYLEQCSAIIDTCSWLTSCLYRRLDDDLQMIAWVNYIIDIVCWMKHDRYERVVIVHEPQDETSGPRDKSNGSLVKAIHDVD